MEISSRYLLGKVNKSHLEQLDPDDREEELQQQGDHHNVADGLDGDDQTLDHLLQPLGPVDGPQWPQHTQHTEDLEEADTAASEDGDEGHGHDHDVQDVEGGAAEGALVEQEAVRDQLQAALAREDCREHVVEISEGLKIF